MAGGCLPLRFQSCRSPEGEKEGEDVVASRVRFHYIQSIQAPSGSVSEPRTLTAETILRTASPRSTGGKPRLRSNRFQCNSDPMKCS